MSTQILSDHPMETLLRVRAVVFVFLISTVTQTRDRKKA
jgi:hypothetical protein